MHHTALAVTLVVVMVALIIGVDVAFLRHHFGWRLATNIGIVLVFGLLYLGLRNL